VIFESKKKNINLKNISEIPPIGDPEAASVNALIFCSVVTTSLNPTSGDILRINLKLCYTDDKDRFSKCRKTVSFFQDPGRELTSDEVRFVDFSAEESRGESIDWPLVTKLLSSADLIVSHNSSFTKPWIEKYTGEIKTLWGCSMDQVDWSELGFPSRSLSVLSVFSGFFYDFNDSCQALSALTQTLEINDVISSLLKNAKAPDLQVFAANAPRDMNHLLKERRYRWNPDVGCWWLAIKNREQGEKESEWLKENLPGTEPQIFEIDPKFRFSK